MMVVDASALVAILLNEPEKADFIRALTSARGNLSPVGYWEAHTRLHSFKGAAGVADLEALIQMFEIRIVPADGDTARMASRTQVTFGKRTPARLNLGDCFTYALARELDAPLLYKGDDFTRTDVKSVLPY
jgi:ribonuclease VapC